MTDEKKTKSTFDKKVSSYISTGKKLGLAFAKSDLEQLVKNKIVTKDMKPAEVYLALCKETGIEPRILGRQGLNNRIKAQFNGLTGKEILEKILVNPEALDTKALK